MVRRTIATCRPDLLPARAGTTTWRAATRVMAHSSRCADVVVVGSYVPEGIAVGRPGPADRGGITAFYDIDTPVTLVAARGRLARLSGAAQIAALRPRSVIHRRPDPGAVSAERHGARWRARCTARSTRNFTCPNAQMVPRPSTSGISGRTARIVSQPRSPVARAARRGPPDASWWPGRSTRTEIAWPANVTRVCHVDPLIIGPSTCRCGSR